MNYKKRLQIYKRAVDEFGAKAQATVAIEEFSELIKPLCKFIGRDQIEYRSIVEEIADCKVMIEQLEYTFGIPQDDIQKISDQKLERLEKKISEIVNARNAATNENEEKYGAQG